MPNPKRGEVVVVIGNEERILRLDFNAIADLEAMHGGRPIHELLDPKYFGMGVLRNGLFCALRAGDPRGTRTLTVQKVGEWMADDSDRLEEITAKLIEATSAAMPAAEVPTKPAPPAAAPVTVIVAPAAPVEDPAKT